MRVFNKLVRDNIPDKILNNGEVPETRILLDDEYKLELNKKLIEEANEVINAKDKKGLIEELGDLNEVINHILDINNISYKELEEKRKEKKKKLGGFSKKIFLISTKSKDE